MKTTKQFTLIFRSKFFPIPSDFKHFEDADSEICQQLRQKKEYEVKSKAKETTFSNFVNFWVNCELPSIRPDNINEYELLSREFDIMKNVIEMYKNHRIDTNGNSTEIYLNQKKKLKYENKIFELKSQNNDYQSIIEAIFTKSEFSDFSEFLLVKKALFYACEDYDLPQVLKLIKETVYLNNLEFYLNKEDKTAKVRFVQNNTIQNGVVNIPKSIIYEDTEFIITHLCENSFKNVSNVETVKFSEDSEIKVIERNAFSSSSIKHLCIPSSIAEFNENWCFDSKITEIEIIEREQKNIKCYDDKFVLAKSDIKSDIFDVLLFANRDIEEATIPSFIKIISSYAFSFCQNLQIIEFEKNSQLKTIESNAFSNTSIEKFIVPSTVCQIGEDSFYGCPIKILEFEENSQLKTLEQNLFLDSEIETIEIPSNVIEIKEGWCCGANKLTNVTVNPQNKNFIIYQNDFLLSKSDQRSDNFDIILFARRDIENVVIPSNIKRIASYSFDSCDSIETFEFEANSNLISFGIDCFSFGSIKEIIIPSSVEIIEKGAFFSCSDLTSVTFEPNSKLRIIGNEAFDGTSITSFSVPNTVLDIGEKTFNDCECMTKIEINEGSKLKAFNSYLFYNCGIESLSIPSNIIELKFGWCSEVFNLNRIEISPNNRHFFLYNNKYILSKSDQKSDSFDILQFAVRNIVNAHIPSFITQIAPHAFSFCKKLSIISFSDDSKLEIIDESAFENAKVNCLSIPSSVKIIGKFAFSYCEISKITFNDNSNLERIKRSAFEKNPITSFCVPPQVTKIGIDAFQGCTNLQIIELSNSFSVKPVFFKTIQDYYPDAIVMIPIGKYYELENKLNKLI